MCVLATCACNVPKWHWNMRCTHTNTLCGCIFTLGRKGWRVLFVSGVSLWGGRDKLVTQIPGFFRRYCLELLLGACMRLWYLSLMHRREVMAFWVAHQSKLPFPKVPFLGRGRATLPFFLFFYLCSHSFFTSLICLPLVLLPVLQLHRLPYKMEVVFE